MKKIVDDQMEKDDETSDVQLHSLLLNKDTRSPQLQFYDAGHPQDGFFEAARTVSSSETSTKKRDQHGLKKMRMKNSKMSFLQMNAQFNQRPTEDSVVDETRKRPKPKLRYI